MTPPTRIKYTGTALPTNADTFTLVDTTTAASQGALVFAGVKRYTIDIKHSHDGTLKLYKSPDKGTTWHLLNTVAMTGGGTDTNRHDELIEGYLDFKATWTNGGVTQTTFSPDQAFVYDRAAAV